MRLRPVLTVVLVCAAFGLAGCGGKGQTQAPEAKLTRPGKRAPAPPPVREAVVPAHLVTAATKEVAAGLRANDPVVRAHAVEAARQTLPAAFERDLVAALDDPSPQVRVAAAMAAGELKLAAAADALLRHAGDDDDLVQIAVRFALHRLGDTRLSRDLELFAQSDKPQVRGMTVLALGLLDEPSALNVLRPMQADRNPAVRLQVSEAMWRLGSEQGLANLAAAAVSAYPDDQMIAFLALAQPRDRRVIEHVRGGLVADYDEARLVAARGMGLLASDEGYVLAARGVKSVDPRQRVLAGLAFGAIGRKDAIDLVAPLLTDPVPDVRLAGATAVLQLARSDG